MKIAIALITLPIKNYIIFKSKFRLFYLDHFQKDKEAQQAHYFLLVREAVKNHNPGDFEFTFRVMGKNGVKNGNSDPENITFLSQLCLQNIISGPSSVSKF